MRKSRRATLLLSVTLPTVHRKRKKEVWLGESEVNSLITIIFPSKQVKGCKMKTKLKLKPRLHKSYLYRFLQVLPEHLASFDTTRVVLAYFSLSGLDVLNGLDKLTDDKKHQVIEWVYSLQITNNEELVSGFQGSSTLNTSQNQNKNAPYKWSHIASTYTALCTLLILGDDLSRVDKQAIASSLRTLQLPSGEYIASKEGTESDMRFLYCAACISYIIDDWSGVNKEKATDFVINSLGYDCAFGQGPELEAHGGSSYCAVAALALMDRLHCLSYMKKRGLIRWLLQRQGSGFQGRPNKPVDTCYSFWIGAALKILGAYSLINFEENESFVLTTQDNVIGGFSKWVDTSSDPLHTYLGLAGLSLMKYDGLNEVTPFLNITCRAYAHLKTLHKAWRGE